MKIKINLSERQWGLLLNTLENGDKECEDIVHLIRASIKRHKEAGFTHKQINTLEDLERKQYENTERKRRTAEQYRAELILKQTSSEKKVKAVLKSLDIKYEFQHIFLNSHTFHIADFYLPKYNIVLEVDGEYHATPEQIKLDAARDKTLKKENGIKHIGRILNADTKLHGEEIRRKIQAIIDFSLKIKTHE